MEWFQHLARPGTLFPGLVGEQQDEWNDLRKQAALREAELAELQALTTYGQEELGEEDEERTVLYALQAAAVAEQEQKDAQMVEEEWRQQRVNQTVNV